MSRMITIRHTRAEGTLLEGSRKGDGVWEVLKAQGRNWKWSREIGLYLGQSRDRAAKTWVINAAAEALRAAGFEVEVEIDDTARRAFAEAEADRYERAEERADRFGEYAENAARRSRAAWQRSHQISERFAGGQPILVGHHSEGRARRDHDRMDSAMRRSAEEDGKATRWSDRAGAAADYQARRESVPTTLRRIEKLEAERRSWQRALDGKPDGRTLRGEHDGYKPAEGRYLERVRTELEQIDEQLAYWREHIRQREAEGVKIWSKSDFAKGDFVLFSSTWFEVLRVSGKSVTIPAMVSGGRVVTRANSRLSWTDTVPYHQVRGRKSADEMRAALAGEAVR